MDQEWTTEQKEFEKKYHLKIVRPLGKYFDIPLKDYSVTSALYKWEKNDITIFSIIALDYDFQSTEPEKKHWFTIKLKLEDLYLLEDFEIQ